MNPDWNKVLHQAIEVQGKTERDKYLPVIMGTLDERTRMEQLAEEAAELAQAALKCIRALGETRNGTPVSYREARINMESEGIDVMNSLCAVFGVEQFDDMVDYVAESDKWSRWAGRLEGKAE